MTKGRNDPDSHITKKLLVLFWECCFQCFSISIYIFISIRCLIIGLHFNIHLHTIKKKTWFDMFFLPKAGENSVTRWIQSSISCVLTHLNFTFNVPQYTCISSRESNLGPCKARHQDVCSINIEHILYAIFY